jgi:hypothetical protein
MSRAKKVMTKLIALVLTMSMVFSVMFTNVNFADNQTFAENAVIKKTDLAVKNDITKNFDENVMFKLPETVAQESDISIIKPKKLGISAKEAYTKFAYKFANNIDIDTRKDFKNDLEWAILNDYKELQNIKQKYPYSMMTGSGSTYFSLIEEFCPEEGYWVKNGLKSVSFGVKEV